MALIHCEACANWFDRRTTARPTGVSGVGEGECRHGAPHPDVGAGGTGRAHWPGTGPKDFCFEAEAGAPVKEQDLIDLAALPPGAANQPGQTDTGGTAQDFLDQPASVREAKRKEAEEALEAAKPGHALPPGAHSPAPSPTQTQAQSKEPSHVRKP